MTTPPEPGTTAKPAKTGKPGKKDNVFTRKVGPLPAWAWMAIVAAALLLFVMWKGNKTSSTGAGGRKQGGGGTQGLAALVPPVVTRARHGHRRHGDDDDEDTDPGGPDRRPGQGPGPESERDYLQQWTGSKHPWTWLHTHSREGSRAQDERDRKHRRDHDDAAESATVTTRPVPGQPAAGVRGQLMSFTTAAQGPTPSLAQVASANNTAPDAIIEEATGRGNPHGAMWRRYVARHDWTAPLPHGTDMTILRQPR